MNMFMRLTSRIPRVAYFMMRRVAQLLAYIGIGVIGLTALLASIMFTIKVTGSEGAGIAQLVAICMAIMAYLTVWTDRAMGKVIPNPLKETIKRFFIIWAVLAVVAGVIALILALAELSFYWFGSPLPFVGLIVTIAAGAVIYAMAKEDVEKERNTQDKILDELSKE